jgi:hypothetical protein
MSEFLEGQALRYKCEYCTASPGQWCRTLRGAKATMLHSVRSEGVRLAWLDGYEEGQQEGEWRAQREMGGQVVTPIMTTAPETA